jgi:hypothetical protein
MARISLKTFSSSSSTASSKDLSGLITKKAFEIYEKSGRKPGRDLDNWLEAEKVIKAKYCK